MIADRDSSRTQTDVQGRGLLSFFRLYNIIFSHSFHLSNEHKLFDLNIVLAAKFCPSACQSILPCDGNYVLFTCLLLKIYH